MQIIPMLEQNLKHSFHAVRRDIEHLERQHALLLERVQRLEQEHDTLLRRIHTPPQINSSGLQLIADKRTKEVHREDCILARSADPEHKLFFYSTFEAHHKGFSNCICLA